MYLNDCRFYCAGNELNFSIFSDAVCRARYLDSIEMTLIGETRVDVYGIDPAPTSRWIVVRQTEGDGMVNRFFLPDGEAFIEKDIRELPSKVRSEVFVRFPHLVVQPMPAAA